MKSNFLLIGTLFLFLTLGFTSCSDDDGGSGTGVSVGTIKANIDGAGFNANIATSGNLVTQGAFATLTILGTNADGQALNFVINGFDGEGTYDIGGANTIFVTASYTEANASNPMASQSWQAPYEGDAVRGTLSISSDSGSSVQGTFEFTAKNSNDGTVVDVTNGEFNIEYTTF